jgi:hypothetical protein
MIDIKDISGNLRFSTPINEGSKRKFLLMKEDYITLKFSLANPVYFQLGDGVDNDLGIFELVDLYKPAYNTTTGAYDYELRLDAYYWKWKNKKFFYTPEATGREAGWNLTAPLNVHLNVFLDNLKALGYKFRKEEFTYEIDNTVANTSKLVSYDNVNLIDALTQMAETWECEWWITEHVIHFGRCEYSSPVDFKAGDLTDTENVNVNSMQRSDSQTTYATRVYAFGSTRNIPASYRKSLIFDVKKVDGRIISDTARPLSNIFFPSSTKIEGGLYLKFPPYGMYNFPESQSIASKTDQKTFSGLLSGGKYKIKVTSFSCEFLGGDRTDGLKDFIKLEVWLTYNTQGEVKQLAILSEEKSIPQTPAGTKVYLDIPSKEIEFVLPDDSSEIIIATKWSAKRVRSTDSYNVGMYALNYVPVRAYSSPVIVTFLSGSNAGKSYQAIYNATFLPEPDSNFIFLPEGVTASIGDRYTINNIIKGKVPDNYFSKDDKELTLNGVVQKRLMLPEGIPYVDAYRYSPTGERIDIGDERYDNPDNVEMPIEEAVEEIVIFEDEYPQYIGNTDIVPKPKDGKDDNGDKYPIYTFKDTELKNFTKDFRLNGELRLIFQTGKLSGLDFEISIKESDNTGTTFEIIRNDDYGRYLPDDILFPQATHMEDGKEVPADTYVLYGFDTAFISEQILSDSEQKLLEATKKYVKKSMIDPSTYDCEMDADFIYNNGNIRTYEVGDKINLINRAYFTNGRQSRIIGFEWSLDIPYDHPIYTVGETAAYSRIGEIESKLDNLTYKGHSYSGSVVGGGGTSVYVIGVNDKTLPSDRNVFSSRKSLATFLRKDQEDTTDYLLKLLGGIMTGKIELGDFTPGTLGSGGIIQVDADGKTYLEVDKAYFRMKAIFDSLVIKDAQHVSGEQIITNASIECTKVDNVAEFALYDVNGCELYDINGVQLYSSEKRYRCYFTADDGEQAILSQFVAGDFAMCRQFNIKAGVYDGVSNRYYWRYVMEVGDNYIDLSIEDCDAGSDIPQAGDTIIQLGNRTDVSRQNAIIMSSYGENAPLKQMLQGIDSYSLADKVILEEGFDRVTNQGYTKNYGRSYVGDRDKKSYLEYVPGSGLEARCSIKGISDDGNSVYDLRPDGTCFFGKTDPDSGKKTGIIQGVDCFIGGSKRTGIFAVVDDEVVFELDPVTKQYKFIGEVYSDKGKVGGFDIDSYILENKSGQNALIRITNDYRKTTAALGNAIPGITGFGCGSYFEASKAGDSDNRAVMIRATGSTYEFWGGGNRNICIDAVGGSYWRMNEGDHWCMPGVLSYVYLEVWYNGGNPTLNQKTWGNGIEFVSIGYEGASPGAGNNYIVIKYRCSHDRVMCIPQNMGMDWNGLSKWGLTPCVESINDIVVQANPPTRMARFTFWSNDGSKYIPNKSLYVFIGEPNNS